MSSFNVELTPKVVASAFWRGEVENELRRIGITDFKFKMDSDYEKCMTAIDKLRNLFIPTHLLIALQSVLQVECMHRSIYIAFYIAFYRCK